MKTAFIVVQIIGIQIWNINLSILLVMIEEQFYIPRYLANILSLPIYPLLVDIANATKNHYTYYWNNDYVNAISASYTIILPTEAFIWIAIFLGVHTFICCKVLYGLTIYS